MPQTLIHCDYFRFTLPRVLLDHEIDTICSELFGYKFSQFDRLPFSRCRYAECYSLNNLVSVYRRGTANNKHTTCFDIPGSGLRELEAIDVIKLCKFVLEQGGNITRFDIAADDLGNVLPFDEVVKLCMGESFKERVRTKLCRNRKDLATGELLQTLPAISIQPRRIQFGSEKSDNYAVVYDREYVAGASYPFIRVELRLTARKDTAALAKALVSESNPSAYLAGVIRGKLDFLRLDNARKDRRSSTEWWLKFLNSAEAKKLKRELSISGGLDVRRRDLRVFSCSLERIIEKGDSEEMQLVISMLQNKLGVAYPDLDFT